ncbi:MAG TPA: S8 family serine peptidase [Chitinophagaceae bacterium]|nr:S8 family serine peptidase [Chitinophagaceae bacterium]
MWKKPILLATAWAFLLLSGAPAFAQTKKDYRLLLNSGTLLPDRNLSTFTSRYNDRVARSGRVMLAVIQFEEIPGPDDRRRLSEAGIDLLDYIPNNAYTATLHGRLDPAFLQSVRTRALVELAPEQKMSIPLARGVYPRWAVRTAGTVDVWIRFPRSIAVGQVMDQLRQLNLDVVSSQLAGSHILALRVPQARLRELASQAFVEYMDAAPHPDQDLNFPGVNDARAGRLNAPLTAGGLGLHGEGVTVGVGDNADPTRHIDFTGRLINRNSSIGQSHGLHVMGTVAGAGLIEERYTGFAPKATLLSQAYSGIFLNGPQYVQDYNMVITNNSYGEIVGDCDYAGVYDMLSAYLDQQAFDLPHLQNVFAAGNDGGITCRAFPPGFATVLGSYQSAKNVIDVANTLSDGTLNGGSSKGPVKDGRIKPEISAMGTGVTSTWPVNTYASQTGTSMACPAVSGGLVLLYQRYRQLNANADPPNALMKALLCNGATDLGNPGPDYSYGFGWMNLLRSADMLTNHHYFLASAGQGGSNTHTITVPAGTAQLKVMLYWNDPAASPLAGRALVNDLDLSVSTPSGTSVLPFVLDTTEVNANNPATRGADHMNNVEQVVIDNPAAGDYQAQVRGFSVTQGAPQDYVVVYDLVPVATTLTFPAGGETLVPGETVTVNWDSYGDPASGFTVEYSLDNGGTWTTLSSTVAATQRQLAWTVPAAATTQALVRVTRNGTGLASTSQPFTILGRPTISLASVQCEGYIALTWTPVTGATGYEVMMVRGDQMIPMATTTATNYTFSGLSRDTTYWVTVRATLGGQPGLRAKAVSRQPNSGTCAGSISDNDLRMDAILAPVSGRQFTSTGLGPATPVTVRIKNLDNAPVTSYNLSYFVNGTLIATDAVVTPVAAGGLATHSFATTYDFSAVGSYDLLVVVKNTAATDPVAANDSLRVTIRQIANGPLGISPGNDFLDDLEGTPAAEYYSRQLGMPAMDRYDFVAQSAYGRLRTFVNTGIAYSGQHALTLDASQYVVAGNTDSLTATFNLGAYHAATDDIRLDFRYKNHGQLANPANQVWIRGNDQQPWLPVYDLFANQADPGVYKKSASIELGNLLSAGSQDYSSSFQVRWGQWGQLLTADDFGGAGYTFDDIHLYQVLNDMQLIRIDSPFVSSCGLNAGTPVTITLRNASRSVLANVPVRYRIDGGAWVNETVPAVGPLDSLTYQFTTPANLASFGSHQIEAQVQYPGDNFPDNDTLSVLVNNAPVISSFPYREDFEAGNGHWYTAGTASSWEYGTPSSPKINRAASGSKAWKTRLSGNYNDMEYSFLYSPCFNLTGMVHPTLSFSFALDLEDCGNSLCDGAWVEYSADGKTWTRLGTDSSGFNWYNKSYTGSGDLWSIENATRWHVATCPLPAGLSNLRLRFVLKSDPAVNREGLAVDDIHLYDRSYGIYDGPSLAAPVTQNVAGGSSWIDFTSGGQLVASVLPAGQALGNTGVRVYVHTDSVRYYNGQYYLDRNLTIKPARRSLDDSATVRFYFLQSEADSLTAAAGCPGCTRPGTAFDLGVSKYSDPADSLENGTVMDDSLGTWAFILPAQTVKVPYDRGYYAEFRVRDFSEFWLSDGGPLRNHYLPVALVDLQAARDASGNVQVRWTSDGELQCDHYEVQVARGNDAYQHNAFSSLGLVTALNGGGQHAYTYNDGESGKSGARYYRLKIVDSSGGITYSPARPVVFDPEARWQIYPNPSGGLFYLVYQLNSDEHLSLRVYDLFGRVLEQLTIPASGFVQKQAIDLQSPRYAAGLYLVDVTQGSHRQLFRLVKQ